MSYFTDSTDVKELSSKAFDDMQSYILNDKKCACVMFYANWCPHCKDLAPVLSQVAATATFMHFYALDCAVQKGHAAKINEEVPKMIPGYPTLIFYHNGEPLATYDDERDVDSLLKACMKFAQGTCLKNK
jgi:thiol-disulfide isomerase/thioredoxin